MNTVIHLKTARVYGHNDDGSPKIERTIVKLEDGSNFNKFIKHMYLKGFMDKEPPTVVKILQKSNGKFVEISGVKWQTMVDKEIANNKQPTKVDYKALSEKQANEIANLKIVNDGVEERLKALETPKVPAKPKEKTPKRLALETKAKELKIAYKSASSKKLLEKIQKIEPDFKL